MELKKPIVTVFNLNSTSERTNIISLSHTDDKEVDVIELILRQGLNRLDLTGATVVARMVWEEDNALASDNVACTVSECGNILIPFDSAVIPLRNGILKVEINIVSDNSILTLQTPLRVQFNTSILENAEVTPESKGTIPELLENVEAELKRVKGYTTPEEVNEIIDAKGYSAVIEKKQDKLDIGNADEIVDVSSTGTMKRSGYSITTNKSVISTKPSASKFIPNAKAVAEYVEEHNGTDNYSDLSNKPTLNGKTIEGNLTTADFNLKDGKDGKSIIGAKIIMGDLYLLIEVENEVGEKLIERKHIGRVVGANGTDGKNGDGYSAAEINANGDLILTVLTGDGKARDVNLGHVIGADGANGKDGKDGAPGKDGMSAYEIAVAKGEFSGTVEEWLESLKGADGFSPTVETREVGTQGYVVNITDKNGTKTFMVKHGTKGEKGDTYTLTAADKTEIATEAAAKVNVPTKTSQLTNDSGFLTAHQDISGKADKLSIGNENELVSAASTGAMKRSGYTITENENVIADKSNANKFIANARAVAKAINSAIQTAIGGVENGSY